MVGSISKSQQTTAPLRPQAEPHPCYSNKLTIIGVDNSDFTRLYAENRIDGLVRGRLTIVRKWQNWEVLEAMYVLRLQF